MPTSLGYCCANIEVTWNLRVRLAFVLGQVLFGAFDIVGSAMLGKLVGLCFCYDMLANSAFDLNLFWCAGL